MRQSKFGQQTQPPAPPAPILAPSCDPFHLSDVQPFWPPAFPAEKPMAHPRLSVKNGAPVNGPERLQYPLGQIKSFQSFHSCGIVLSNRQSHNTLLLMKGVMFRLKGKQMSPKSTSPLPRILLTGILALLLACVVVIVLLSLWIELHVKKMCEMATLKYPGDRVQALMMSVQTNEYGYDAHRYNTNNHLLWALGQLGDDRALPFLKNLLTGQPCDHETNISQGEIKKAIRKLETNQFNLPKFLWRRILNT